MLDSTKEFKIVEELFSDKKLDGLFKVTKKEWEETNNCAWEKLQTYIVKQSVNV